jgi:starvation-inducible outer membrane lipoprotein
MTFFKFASTVVALPLAALSATACTEPLFPAAVVKDLDPSMQMGIFNPEADTYFKGQLGQVGGRVIAVAQTDDGVFVTADELPLSDHATSLAETAKSGGQFIFLYRGVIDRAALQRGNKFIMIGIVEGTQRISIDGIQRTLPYLVARCVHVWKTGTYDIADFPDLTDGYTPLVRQTYCSTSSKNSP